LSLLEAVTITPMRAAALLRAEPKITRFEKFLDEKFHAIADWYRRLLERTLQHSLLVVFVSLAVFAVSLVLITKVRQEFVPPQDQNIIIVSGQTPPGSS